MTMTTTTSRSKPQVLTMTDAAARRVREIMDARPDVVGLKVGVKKGGCAGMEYTMSWADSISKFDEVVEDKGVRILIDPMAIMYLIGTEMDYKTEKLSSQFVFNNPNQLSACGCGESVELVAAPKDKLQSTGA
ncbi:MAG: HesB/IscA family protein [Hyphomicrobiaceae bacterium]